MSAGCRLWVICVGCGTVIFATFFVHLSPSKQFSAPDTWTSREIVAEDILVPVLLVRSAH